MNYVWNVDGIRIGSITMNRWEMTQMWTSGFAFVDRRDARPTEVLQWEATALHSGWYIVISRSTGKVGEYQGSTFNLPLEISTAVRRLA